MKLNTYQFRKEEERYARKAQMKEIEENNFNLNISLYVSTAKPEPRIDLEEVNKELVEIEKKQLKVLKNIMRF